MLGAIWAQDKNGLIGKNDQLPWHLPNDLKHFKANTLNKNVVMGRKTFEGFGKRPLPNRVNIVLTRDTDYLAGNVIVLHTLEEVLEFARASDKETMIIGGSQIYQAFEPFLDELYVTYIDGVFEGDAHFPEFDWTKFEKVSTEQGNVDEKNKYPHEFVRYTKIK
ncbi:MAG: dihydrofolate reductase [Streptococcaceae bacterium]|jgi:dihydrofolate reductase|nr:dihydrofolate reductase [Streptococcaceae bacterium]